MHQTHLLLQINKNFVSGQNQPDARAANNYLTQILPRERPDGTTIPISNFGRIEFQDGKRKKATQSYHGSGRPHLHRLEFVTKKRTQEDLQTFQLHNTIAASTTNLSQQMTKYVLASQLDWSCATPLPVIEEESRFDPDTNTYHIQHTIEDKKNGMRAFFTPIMEATTSHQDVQLDAHGEENYAAYTAKYAPKFSDSLYEELLNDDADANSVAASVLSRYHPGVPEMMLQLFGSLFHQWHISTHSRGKKTFIVPTPLNDPQPKEIHLYMKSTWRHDDMRLLEFLRKSTEEGIIAPWIKEAWKHQNNPETLEKFANEVCTDGEKVIACAMGSRLKDQF